MTTLQLLTLNWKSGKGPALNILVFFEKAFSKHPQIDGEVF